MGQFEYLMGLVSIIMGLGIASLLQGAATLLRTRHSNGYWVHSLWVVTLLVWHVGVWALRWELRDRPSWTVGQILIFLVVPVLLFLLSDLLFPDTSDEAGQDLKAYYYDNAASFFGVSATLCLAVAWTQAALFPSPTVSADVVAPVLGAVLSGLLALNRGERLHELGGLGAITAVVLTFIWARVAG